MIKLPIVKVSHSPQRGKDTYSIYMGPAHGSFSGSRLCWAFDDVKAAGLIPIVNENTKWYDYAYSGHADVSDYKEVLRRFEGLIGMRDLYRDQYLNEVSNTKSESGYRLCRSSMMGVEVIKRSSDRSTLEPILSELMANTDSDHEYFEYYIE